LDICGDGTESAKGSGVRSAGQGCACRHIGKRIFAIRQDSRNQVPQRQRRRCRRDHTHSLPHVLRWFASAVLRRFPLLEARSKTGSSRFSDKNPANPRDFLNLPFFPLGWPLSGTIREVRAKHCLADQFGRFVP